MGILNWYQMAAARGLNFNTPVKAEESFMHFCLQYQVGTIVGQQNIGDRAFAAIAGLPAWGIRIALDQATFLNGTAAMKVLVIKVAFFAGGCSHGAYCITQKIWNKKAARLSRFLCTP
jgi:hypothetical protein